jgi:hypothetical protein
MNYYFSSSQGSIDPLIIPPREARDGVREAYKTAFVISLGFLKSSALLQSSSDLGLKNLSRSIPNPN